MIVAKAPPPSSEAYYDLGTFGRPVETSNQEAQVWFNRGLTWIYAFHQDEAVRCFEAALSHDPTCVMAYWGMAFALGPNYNNKWEFFPPPQLKDHMERVHQLFGDVEPYLDKADPLERALVQALKARFPKNYADMEFRQWNEAHVKEMKEVYDKYGANDLDVAALYVDAMMCLTPWKMWDLKTGEPCPGSYARTAQGVLEKAFLDPEADHHPGLLHLYIHLIEMSASPERAIHAADKLLGLIPDAAHLNHMPSHIDVLIGDYRRAIYANARAIVSDEVYVSRSGPGGFYIIYRLHDYQSIIYAAMFNGQYKTAMRFVEGMERSMGEEMVRALPDFVEPMVTTRLHVLVRFGRWDEILEREMPEDKDLYCVTTVMMHYARGLALAAKGKLDEASVELTHFETAFKKVPPSRLHFPAQSIPTLAVGEMMLKGEFEYRRKNYTEAFKHLEEAVHRYDNLQYGEPWPWMMPSRHPYAALLVEQGWIQKALKIYSEDLGYDHTLPRACQHPNNVWSLHGYHECLVKLGRKEEANIVLPQLRLALAIADVKISSSCFCRLEVDESVLYDGPTSRCCV
jgi:tetratricopeptide (TPR) repeat protein